MSSFDPINELAGDGPPECALLPAWFTRRMMYDEWEFGLLLTTGDLLGISHINEVTRDAAGDLWLDVELLEGDRAWGALGHRLVKAPTSRTTASVKVSSIVAAIELADT